MKFINIQILGEWSPCSSTCGGKQVRGVLCIGGSGRHLRDTACNDPKPEHERQCGGECSPTWYSSEWGQVIICDFFSYIILIKN